MTQQATDRELYTFLIHDIQALDFTMHSKLTRINEQIRIINKQPYIHKRIDSLERFKESRKVIDKMISRINDLLVESIKGKATQNELSLKQYTSRYKSLKEYYFKLE